MRITYDEEADAVNICVENAAAHKITNTLVNGNVNIGYDKEGKIVGIEILDTTEPCVEYLR